MVSGSCSAAPAKAISVASTRRSVAAGWPASTRYGGPMGCVFCEIVAGTAPAIRVYEDDDHLGILDIRPFTRGHTLVLPKRHTVDLTDTPETCLRHPRTVGSVA